MHDVNFGIIDQISQIVSRKEVGAALEEMLAEKELVRIPQAIHKMRTKPAYVAAIGSQGAGKSSLLNSLLFPRRVLPIGEGVTTNIVCFIQDAHDGDERCEVSLGNKVEKFLLDRATLELFMDEAQNPKNYKGVTRITCFTRSDLLSKSTHFVDTPGLGAALNEQGKELHLNLNLNSHDRAALDFVAGLSLGIFVHRTTPPLLESEIKFLEMIWKTSPEFIFVQNVWGESPQQIQESLHVNRETLTRLAEKIGDPRPICLLPVNIHEGLEGVTNVIQDKVEQSGLAHLRSLIKARISRGGQRLEITIQAQQIMSCFRLSIHEAKTQLAATSVKEGPEIEKLKEQIDEAEALRKWIKDSHGERAKSSRATYRDYLKTWQRKIMGEIESVRKKFASEVRARGGQPNIDREYLDELQRVILGSYEDSISEFRKNCENFVQESSVDIDRILESIQIEVPQSLEDITATHVVEKAGKVVASTGRIALTGLTAVSAGIFAESLIGGATAASALSAGAAAIPGIGWGIALVILAVGYVLKEGAKQRRVNTLVDQFDKVAKALREKTVDNLQEETKKALNIVMEGVEGHMRAAVAQQEKQIESLKAILYSTEEERAAQQARTSKRLQILQSAGAEIERLVDVYAVEPLNYKAESGH